MKDRLLEDRRVHVSWAVLAPALIWPAAASAAQVGCFFTAVFLGIMFTVCLGITEIGKHLVARHFGGLARTPWLRLFGITWLELFIGVAVFVLAAASLQIVPAVVKKLMQPKPLPPVAPFALYWTGFRQRADATSAVQEAPVKPW